MDTNRKHWVPSQSLAESSLFDILDISRRGTEEEEVERARNPLDMSKSASANVSIDERQRYVCHTACHVRFLGKTFVMAVSCRIMPKVF
jgi:hypothetical protein